MFDAMLWPTVALGGLGLLLGLGLAIAAKLFAVETDPRVDKLRELLPGANCGGCGFPGCDALAKAVVEGSADVSKCVAISAENLVAASSLLGIEAKAGEKHVARVICRGDSENCISKYKYTGISDCRAAAVLAGGPSACPYGCVGLLTCGRNCPFDAIYLSEKGIATVDEEKCTGCGKCAEVCPKHGIVIMPKSRGVYVACRTTKKGKAVTEACQAGCIACGLCAKKCPEGAITMKDNLPVIDYEKCTGCGNCASVCPRGAMHAPEKSKDIAALG